MTDKTRLGARLRAARKAAGFKTSKTFVLKHNIPASTYSQHESGSRIPDDESLKFYSKIFDVNFNWLKLGKGSPFQTYNSEKRQTISDELINLKKTRPITDVDLLATIFHELAEQHNTVMAFNKIKLLLATSLEIYQNILSSTRSKSMQATVLKKEIVSYKKQQRL